MKLVVVESPAKCAKLQSFLGSGWKVIASMGHIRSLKEDLGAVGIERDFEPDYEWTKEKSKAIASIKDSAKGMETIYLAADDDREGEFIAYSIALLLGVNPATTPRAVFHSITKEEVVKAIQNPRTLDMNRVHAQQARAILDMLIGFTMSPLLWKHVGGQGLSAGRCQTPALRLVLDREKEITSFQSTTAWNIRGTWSTEEGGQQIHAEIQDSLEDEESARNFLENHVTELGATLVSAETRPRTESAPKPLITSTLQQQASSLMRSNPKNTMKIAQRLYEAGHITYMRTDQATLSEEAVQQARAQVAQTWGEEYCAVVAPVAAATPTAKKSKKAVEKTEKAEQKTQDAHEAIRPTHFECRDLPSNEDWSSLDRRIYTLIWQRAIQSVMAPVKGEQRTIVFHSDGGGDDFPWRATFQRTLFKGWRAAALKEDFMEGEAEADSETSLWAFADSLKPQMRIQWSSMEAKPSTTQPPRRFTEATLIRELEKRGIGRPSTFASLIGTLLDRKYVEAKTLPAREQEIPILTLSPGQWPPEQASKKQSIGGERECLNPTPLGESILGFLLQHFDDLFMYPFTAQMEERLDKIASGTEPWKQVLRDTWTTYKKRYMDLRDAASTATDSVGTTHRRDFGQGLVGVMTRKGPVLLKESMDGNKENTIFYGWPQGSYTLQTLPEDIATTFAKEAEAQRTGSAQGIFEGHPILKKSGPYGAYAEWNGLRVPWKEDDTQEMIQEKLREKKEGAKGAKRIGQFEIRTGPYGLYMFKHAVMGPKRQFVSVPATTNLEACTEQDLLKIFQEGIQQKARAKAYTGGEGTNAFRGGRGGRGGRGQRGRGAV